MLRYSREESELRMSRGVCITVRDGHFVCNGRLPALAPGEVRECGICAACERRQEEHEAYCDMLASEDYEDRFYGRDD